MMRIGDLVWWDEGHCVGYIQVIAQTNDDCQNLGLRSPHIMISNSHPFDPSVCIGVAHEVTCLDDQGIRPFTAREQQELERAATEAKIKLKTPPTDLTYTVTTEVQDRRQTGWVFTFFMDSQQYEVVRIPACQSGTGH